MRVIGGRCGGRVLRAPKGYQTRPTAQRARQALFDVLGPLDGLRVLDLYAGSGALGIEALSRGSSHAVFVESSQRALAVLRANLAGLGLGGCSSALGLRVERALRHLVPLGPFGVVFCDPPWAEAPAVSAILNDFDWAGLLAEGARVVLEHPAHSPMTLDPSKGLRLQDRRTWGDTGMSLYFFSTMAA
jgi:16S rRNA (guanine966-N2)-methyltransferase